MILVRQSSLARRRLLVAAALALCVSCGPSYEETRGIDTIEAWQAFLAETNPNSPHYYKGEMRLAELRLDQVRAEGTPEAYDAYLEEFAAPQFKALTEAAATEREDAVYNWADEEGTAAAWQRFLKEYPKARRKRKSEARRRIKMGENMQRIKMGSVRQERINLAEDPEGPLNGWGWEVDVTNVGDLAIERLALALYLLDEEGGVIDRKDWPVVARRLPGYLPFEEGFDKPMESGDTRTWEYTDGDMPELWSRRVRVAPVAITFVGETEEEEEK